MKMRVPVAALVALAMTLTACGDDGGSALQQAADDAPQVDDDTTNDATDDATDDDTSDQDGRDQDTNDGSDDEPGLDDLPDMGELGDCLTISMTYAGLGLASLGGLLGGEEISDDDLAELQKSIAELRGELPKEIQDEFAVVAEAYSTAAEKGFMSDDAMEALESDEFLEADAAVQEYLEEICG